MSVDVSWVQPFSKIVLSFYGETAFTRENFEFQLRKMAEMPRTQADLRVDQNGNWLKEINFAFNPVANSFEQFPNRTPETKFTEAWRFFQASSVAHSLSNVFFMLGRPDPRPELKRNFIPKLMRDALNELGASEEARAFLTQHEPLLSFASQVHMKANNIH